MLRAVLEEGARDAGERPFRRYGWRRSAALSATWRRQVIIWDDQRKKDIGQLHFRHDVKAVRLRRDRVVVVLEYKARAPPRPRRRPRGEYPRRS